MATVLTTAQPGSPGLQAGTVEVAGDQPTSAHACEFCEHRAPLRRFWKVVKQSRTEHELETADAKGQCVRAGLSTLRGDALQQHGARGVHRDGLFGARGEESGKAAGAAGQIQNAAELTAASQPVCDDCLFAPVGTTRVRRSAPAPIGVMLGAAAGFVLGAQSRKSFLSSHGSEEEVVGAVVRASRRDERALRIVRAGDQSFQEMIHRMVEAGDLRALA